MQSQMTSLIPWFDGLHERTFYSRRCFQTIRNSQNIRERYSSNQRRHQIFSLANNWSNPVTCLNMPYLKLGSMREVFPRFQNGARSSKLTVFLELCSKKTVRFPEQIISAEKFHARYRFCFLYLMKNIQFI